MKEQNECCERCSMIGKWGTNFTKLNLIFIQSKYAHLTVENLPKIYLCAPGVYCDW